MVSTEPLNDQLMEQVYLWEAVSSQLAVKFLVFSWKPQGPYRVCKSLPLARILRWTNPVHAYYTHVSNKLLLTYYPIYANVFYVVYILMASTPVTSMHFCSPSCSMPLLFHPPCFGHLIMFSDEWKSQGTCIYILLSLPLSLHRTGVGT